MIVCYDPFSWLLDLALLYNNIKVEYAEQWLKFVDSWLEIMKNHPKTYKRWNTYFLRKKYVFQPVPNPYP